nr:hypothetical protein C1892_07735 [Pseudomonas sp. MPBD7-1]
MQAMRSFRNRGARFASKLCSHNPLATDCAWLRPFAVPNRCMRKQASGVKYISRRFIVADLRFIK